VAKKRKQQDPGAPAEANSRRQGKQPEEKSAKVGDDRMTVRDRRIVLIAPPGAGKSTQATRLAERFRIPWISTGELLRAAVRENTRLGQQAKTFMERGEMVPDDVVIALVRERLAQPDCAGGFILDGFPRTPVQAEALKAAGVVLDYVIELELDEQEAILRLSGRRVHPASGRTYHVVFQPPKVPDKDDITGEDLVQREDDREEAVRTRLRVYRQQTEPVLAFYRQCAEADCAQAPVVRTVSASGTPEEVAQRLLAVLEA
jgi:adenylate kinase